MLQVSQSSIITIDVCTYAGFEAGTAASLVAAGSFFALGSRFLAADLEATGASSPESSSAAKKFDDWISETETRENNVYK